jgi:hypothetical protein
LTTAGWGKRKLKNKDDPFAGGKSPRTVVNVVPVMPLRPFRARGNPEQENASRRRSIRVALSS